MQSLLTRFPRTQQWRIYCQKYRFKELKIFYLPDLSLPLPLLIHISKEVKFWVEVEWPEGGGDGKGENGRRMTKREVRVGKGT